MITLISVVSNCMCSKEKIDISDRELAEYALSVGWTGMPEELFDTAKLFRENPEEAARMIYSQYR